MKKLIVHPETLETVFETEETPLCGRSRCDQCGNCLHCYETVRCPGSDSLHGPHLWIECLEPNGVYVFNKHWVFPEFKVHDFQTIPLHPFPGGVREIFATKWYLAEQAIGLEVAVRYLAKLDLGLKPILINRKTGEELSQSDEEFFLVVLIHAKV